MTFNCCANFHNAPHLANGDANSQIRRLLSCWPGRKVSIVSLFAGGARALGRTRWIGSGQSRVRGHGRALGPRSRHCWPANRQSRSLQIRIGFRFATGTRRIEQRIANLRSGDRPASSQRWQGNAGSPSGGPIYRLVSRLNCWPRLENGGHGRVRV